MQIVNIFPNTYTRAMSKIVPFRGIRPRPDIVSRVIAPPYDVLDSAEARELADGNPQSWLHVSKPEIDLDPSIDLYDPRVYAKARENFNAFMDAAYFVKDLSPVLYVYRLSISGHTQTGVIAGAAVAEYEAGLIKKHELTRADKEEDRTKHTETLEAHSGPVFLTYRRQTAIDALVAQAVAEPAIYDVTTYDGVRNEIWIVRDPASIASAFESVPALYIADGHHRAASYCKVGAKHGWKFFLAVLFPSSDLRILPYNRVVSHKPSLDDVRKSFEIAAGTPSPKARHTISMYLDGAWHELTPKKGTFDENDPIKSLDVSILQDNLLGPILGIADPRRDKRIDFVGGIRGTAELEKRAGSTGVAFSMYPTSLDELMAIADAGEIMPPKSTWFEPKLKDGFIIYNCREEQSGNE